VTFQCTLQVKRSGGSKKHVSTLLTAVSDSLDNERKSVVQMSFVCSRSHSCVQGHRCVAISVIKCKYSVCVCQMAF
jgi:hypothetical protein